jgi:general secretion pathway protein M
VSGASELLERGLRWWAGLQPREKRVLGGGGALLALALLYLLAFEPAYEGRRKLEAELPALRGQVAQMEALSSEARRLSGQVAQGADSPQQLKAQLEQSIEAAGLKGSMSQLSLAGELIDLRFKGVSFAAWLAWFDAAMRETRLRAVDVSVERETTPGLVSARLTLEAPKRGP